MVNTPPTPLVDAMAFADRLTTLRKDRQLTQATLAERANTHVTQIRRYEAGTSTPTLDVLRNLALALNTSADSLLFDQNERQPPEDLTLHLEAINHLDETDQQTIRSIFEAILLRHDTRRWTNAS